MKKNILFFFFSTVLAIFQTITTTAGKKNPSGEAISKIEKKYEELYKHSPEVKAKGLPVAKEIRFIQSSDKVVEDYSKLRQIALIRHGEPDMVKEGKFTCDEANQFMKCYDSICIIIPEKPFFALQDKEEVAIFSSPLNRALSTAKYICGHDKNITVSPDFREFENKISKTNSKKRFPIKLWTTTARLKWMLGIGKHDGIESFSEAKKRARNAAQLLADATEKTHKVLLTGHGMSNRYIKNNLKKMGWTVVEDTGNNYFGTTILVKLEK